LLGVGAADDLLGGAASGQWNRTDLAALAPAVIAAAEQGDAVAQDIARRAVSELSLGIEAVARSIGYLDAVSGSFEVAIVGGLLNSRYVLHRLREHVHEVLPGAVLVEPDLRPVAGAVLLALSSLYGCPPSALPRSVVNRLRTEQGV
jgi:N-acetylglucosamine kinase-like BadF-type ATPase